MSPLRLEQIARYHLPRRTIRRCRTIDPRKPNAQVFLMGTFHGTPYSGLPIVVRDYFLTVYTENGGDLRTEGYADVAHIHTSPCWTTPTTAWIIPLVVHVPFTELQTRHEIAVNIDGEEEKLCTFVNNNSMDHLERYHNMALQHFNSAIKTEKSRKKVARKLFDQTNIVSTPVHRRTALTCMTVGPL